MSTWQIFSDAGKDFRWEVSGRITSSKLDNDRNIAASPPLPSMVDLLVQGLPKLLENGSGRDGEAPMFTTGLGKSMVLKESSIAKAFSVLGDEIEDRTFNPEEVFPRSSGCGQSSSLFQTGSGKAVNVSSAGLLRAKKLLGLEEDIDHCSFQSFQQPRRVSENKESFGWQSLTNVENKERILNNGSVESKSAPTYSINFKTGSTGSKLCYENDSTAVPSKMFNSASKSPPIIKFHTAGGRSLSVSSDALKRARSLLGDPELGTSFDEADVNDLSFSSSKERRFHHTSRIQTAGGRSISVSSDALKRARSLLGDPELGTIFDEAAVNDLSFSSFNERRFYNTSRNKENDLASFSSRQGVTKSKHTPDGFISPLKSSKEIRSLVNSENISSGSNLIKKFDAVVNASGCVLTDSMEKSLGNKPSKPNLLMSSGTVSRINSVGRSYGGPLTDISNSIPSPVANNKQIMNEKRFARTSTVSPFKRPRTSKFLTPLQRNVPLVLNGLSPLSSESLCCKRTVSTRYPFRVERVYIKEYFAVPPSDCSLLESMSAEVKGINPGNAERYMFRDESGAECIGAEAICDMLVRSGALMQYVSKEWVRNHYRWIVWKLGCYERCYPAKYAGKFLTVSSVLEELKYRYEREINHGHRSAIKRIIEGDTPPSTMLVLCISAIHSYYEPKIETPSMVANGAQNSSGAKVELTDGWYSMGAVLDVLLSKQLAAGKLFVGQKLRIWGAKLCGWVGPLSPLEASKTVNLLLNINGTYRAHWADRLGFCMTVGDPLAFKCIKSDGGLVPRTIVGITRIYPVLYKERLLDGGSVVRSERMESKIMQLYHSRRLIVAEGIISEYQRGTSNPHIHNDSEGEEGAKILKILESAAEPEVIMAEMSPEQLNSFAAYKAKLETSRQSEMEKSIEKALTDAGLSEREVIPFMRVRVVGLTSRSCGGKGRPKEGIITIWSPTEKQKNELVEGEAYSVEGLVPLHSDSEILYLHARGSTTKWKPLSPLEMEHFEPFFSPRKSILLSNLGEIPLSSEFDIAALVVYVGEVYMAAHQKKQWVFVTDDSLFGSQLEDLSNSLLAISFSSPCTNDSYEPINSNLVGSTVGFCNVIKKAKDQMNHLWVAEATENSTYFLDFRSPICSHLRNAAVSVGTWAKISPMIIDKLREKASLNGVINTEERKGTTSVMLAEVMRTRWSQHSSLL
ncbi:hypothetical protein SLE2022_105930 [Rubroshorea leprosula]